MGYLNHQEEKLEEAIRTLHHVFVSEADRLFEEKRYIAPPERNAWALYRAILQIAPTDERVKTKVDAMAAHCLECGNQAFRDDDYAKARGCYEKAGSMIRIMDGTDPSIPEMLPLVPSGGRWKNLHAMWFVRVPTGTFTMGNPDGRHSHEPIRTVTISRDFYLQETEMSQSQWREVMGDNPSEFKGNDLPVHMISWFEAVECCNRLSALEGLEPAYTIEGTEVSWDRKASGYRLPTEAEWEYACRAGTKTGYYTGDSEADLDRAGWYDGNSGGSPHPVGRKAPNAWGLYDMHGNIFELCWDCWLKKYPDGPLIDPVRPWSPACNRTIRGGRYQGRMDACRCDHSNNTNPNHKLNGVRLVRPLP